MAKGKKRLKIWSRKYKQSTKFWLNIWQDWYMIFTVEIRELDSLALSLVDKNTPRKYAMKSLVRNEYIV